MTQKTQGWEIRLSDYIHQMRDKPFKRGRHDCALFAGHCIEQMTDLKVTSEFKKPYKNLKEAMTLLETLGYADFEAVATAKLGEPLSNINYVGRGDCVLIEFEGLKALAIVDLSGKKAVTVTLTGLSYFKPDTWLKGWTV